MSDPIDYWKDVVRRGVLAVGYSLQRTIGEPILAAELAQPQEGLKLRAAYAAIEMHKLASAETGTALHVAQRRLAAALASSPAAAELAAYQGLLIERLWVEVAVDPAQGLERLAYPHEE
ncbi:hypothetical protein [Caulobacter endophyticus]|uniref:Uncharacterized protein n=1 Tax=Caulobacter endophyticus TaxID=2172652 RepID=A0A2T9K3X3_9CAUL|nr:hypothetical protein [Caulobacter endophyticus]PVM90647.1 hypothetical protein DDF67_09455 [Caulobacter endophyticus]